MTQDRLASPLSLHAIVLLIAATCQPILAGAAVPADGLPVSATPAVSAGSAPCRMAWPQTSEDKPHTGTVDLLLLVNVDGRVSDAKIAKSSGYRDLDKATVIGVARCRFEPGLKEGVPVAAWFTLRQVWAIDGSVRP
ncbi:MAG TPA: energy transducer TonB [Telluria sp.]|nr:energy transducer TonB [Telluria sp.]